jgi:hypothetical protein
VKKQVKELIALQPTLRLCTQHWFTIHHFLTIPKPDTADNWEELLFQQLVHVVNFHIQAKIKILQHGE